MWFLQVGFTRRDEWRVVMGSLGFEGDVII